MPAEPRRETFVVDAADAGKRLDQLLAARVAGLSRRQARVVLDLGGVFVGGKRTKVAGLTARAGEKIVVHLGGALARATHATGRVARSTDEARLPSFAILFEDADIVVVDKPAGLLTAPTPESDRNNLSSLLARREDAAGPIFVVHRLDLPTSGVVVFAKTDEANRILGERFRLHTIGREYLAVVRGSVRADIDRVDEPVEGRPALTHLTIEERLGDAATVLRCRLETGRTHQIRVHCRSIGHPVLGDRKYGAPGGFDPPRMALHATRLGFPHPRTAEPLAFERPWPADMAAWLASLPRA
jgi:23S rRNA pseudouridine1911/1915/1917 synthase